MNKSDKNFGQKNRTKKIGHRKSDKNRAKIGHEIGSKNQKKIGQEHVGQKYRAKIGHEIGQKIGHINRHE